MNTSRMHFIFLALVLLGLAAGQFGPAWLPPLVGWTLALVAAICWVGFVVKAQKS